MNNIILQTDSYKLNHWNQYPNGTQTVYSYFESRHGAKFDYTTFFGLQAILIKNLVGQVVTREKIETAAEIAKHHFGSEKLFNRMGWEYILKKYDGGRLPLHIRAVPEGLSVPTGNVLMTVENTDDNCYWLTNAVESILTHVWYPSTVATLSRKIKQTIKSYLEESADCLGGLDFMLHDFGYRGVSSDESAEIGGAAHLINFKGTDTLLALPFLRKYYHAEYKDIAYSVPATEHSIMTSLGKDGECALVGELIEKYPEGILSCVADSYDIYNFVEFIVGKRYKEKILERNGVFVIRPDSVTPMHKTPEEQVVWILNSLWSSFGGKINSKGFKVINPKVRVLWGDGIDFDGITKILHKTVENRFSVQNIATFGMGGGLLQKMNRDTQRFAFKCSAQFRDGRWWDIHKQPLDASKTSKKGRLKLIKQGDVFRTVYEAHLGKNLLETVFLNGSLMRSHLLSDVRENAKI
jgi:nicotinamide phosphoribosyltransferase